MAEAATARKKETPQEAKKANSNLAIRIATAVVCAPLIVLLLYKGPDWGLFLLVLVATLIGAWELFNMTHAGDKLSQLFGTLLAATVSTTLFFLGSDPKVLLTLIVGMALVGPLLTLVRLGDMSTAAMRACAMGMGPLFIGAPLTLLAMMRRDLGGTVGPGFVVMAIMFAWFGDTGGYFAGRFLGKRKLYEAVSPKKTVAGAIGGLGGSVLGAVLASAWFLKGSLPITHGIPLALLAGALGQAGDLGESVLKRSTGVKDSGAIVPGHGGILDRVDALLVTSAVTYLYTIWVMKP